MVEPAPGERRATAYVEGLEADHRLAAILSNKAYFRAWGKTQPSGDPTRALQFGVNAVVFALTQEGSIAKRLVRMN